MRPETRRVVAVTVALVLGAACGDSATSSRQEEVAKRGAEVMPFDLDKTTHRFTPTTTGLVETVVADDPGDQQQVALVRQHLTHEATRFRTGDYADPAHIHGDDMPGLADLQAHPDRVTVTFTARPGGARLTFTGTDPDLVTALHRWAAAQTSDHGGRAHA